MSDSSQPRIPAWFWGALLALALIGISMRGRFTLENPALEEQFAPRPTIAGQAPSFGLPQLDFQNLPDEVRDTARNIQQQLGIGQSVPALTPVAQTQRLRVEMHNIRRTDIGVQLVGMVTNISNTDLDVPVSAFELRGSNGATYVAEGEASVRLAPGESAPLELTVPLPEGHGLMLAIALPPDPPIEQILIVSNEETP